MPLREQLARQLRPPQPPPPSARRARLAAVAVTLDQKVSALFVVGRLAPLALVVVVVIIGVGHHR